MSYKVTAIDYMLFIVLGLSLLRTQVFYASWLFLCMWLFFLMCFLIKVLIEVGVKTGDSRFIQFRKWYK